MRTMFCLTMLVAASVASILPAHACSPPVPPPQAAGESDDAFRVRSAAFFAEMQALILKDQQRLWDRSATVLIVRVKKTGISISNRVTVPVKSRSKRSFPGKTPHLPIPSIVKVITMDDMIMQATLEPIAAAKGALPKKPFIVESTGQYTTCGPTGVGRATYSHTGDVIVVYLLPGSLGTQTVLDVLERESVVDPRVCLLLGQN